MTSSCRDKCIDDVSIARTTIMYVMIGLSTVLIILWGVITVIKYKVHRENEMLQAIQLANARVYYQQALPYYS